MKNTLRSWLRFLTVAGYTEEELAMIAPLADERNKNVVITASALSALVMALMAISTFVVHSYRGHFLYYLGTAVVFIVLYFAAKLALERNGAAVRPFVYLYLVIALSFAIVLGTFYLPENTATTFMAGIFALPLLFFDRAWRMNVVVVFMSVMFCVAAMATKDGQTLVTDLGNAVAFAGISCGVSICMMRVKYDAFLSNLMLEKERSTDGLTQLLVKDVSRTHIEADLAAAAARGESCAYLMFDVDRFKTINDTRGHAYGDAVLRIVGAAVLAAFPKEAVCGRFGGDEFEVLMPTNFTRDRAECAVAGFRSELAGRLENELHTCVTCSIGLAMFPEDGATYDDLMVVADKRLYDEKRAKYAREGAAR